MPAFCKPVTGATCPKTPTAPRRGGRASTRAPSRLATWYVYSHTNQATPSVTTPLKTAHEYMKKRGDFDCGMSISPQCRTPKK